MATSKSVQPSVTLAARSSPPTWSAPASSASLALSPVANTATVTSLPRPWGREIVPRSCWSAWRTLSPVRMCTSTLSSNFALPNSLMQLDRLGRRVLALAVDLHQARAVALAAGRHQPVTSTPIERAVPSMIFDAWSTSCALRSGSLVSAICAHLRAADLADLVAVGLARALVEADGLLDQHRRGRGLGDEGERAVLVDRDLDRDDRAAGVLGLGVERLAELHDVHAVLAQGGADRRSRVGGAAGDLELDEGEDLSCHG